MNFTGQPTQPTNGLDMTQLNDLLGGFKNDIMSGVDDRLNSLPAPPAYEPVDYSGQFGGLEEKISGIEQQLSGMPEPAGVNYDKINSMVSDQINKAVGGLDIPDYQQPDLSPLQNQIGQLNNRFDNLNIPGTDYGKIDNMINDAVGGINMPDAPGVDYDRIGSMIGDQIGSIPQPAGVDLSPIQNQLGELNNRFDNLPGPTDVDYNKIDSLIGDRIGSIPQPADVNLDPLMGRLDQLEGRFDDIPQPAGVDLSGIEGRLDQFGSRLDGLDAQPDLSPLTGQIGELQDQVGGLMNREPYEVDLAPLQGDIAGLKDQFNDFRNNDRSDELIGQFDDLKTQIGEIGQPDLSPIEQRLGGINEQIQGLRDAPGADLTPIAGRLDMLNERFGGFDEQLNDLSGSIPQPEPVDLSPIQNQLDMGFNDIRQRVNQPDPFSRVMDEITQDGTLTWQDREFDLTGIINGNYNGGRGGGTGSGSNPPSINPQPAPSPQPAPQPAPAPAAEDMDWMRYGRDYGEADFNVGGTAGGQTGGQTGGSFPRPGAGGIDLNQMMQNLGLF